MGSVYAQQTLWAKDLFSPRQTKGPSDSQWYYQALGPSLLEAFLSLIELFRVSDSLCQAPAPGVGLIKPRFHNCSGCSLCQAGHAENGLLTMGKCARAGAQIPQQNTWELRLTLQQEPAGRLVFVGKGSTCQVTATGYPLLSSA